MKHGGYGGTHLGSRKSSSGPSRTVAIPSPVGGSCASTTSTGTTTCRSPTDGASESASHQKGEEAGSPQNDGAAVIAKRAATPGGGRHHANTVGARCRDAGRFKLGGSCSRKGAVQVPNRCHAEPCLRPAHSRSNRVRMAPVLRQSATPPTRLSTPNQRPEHLDVDVASRRV